MEFGWFCLAGVGMRDGVLFLLGWAGNDGGLGLVVVTIAASRGQQKWEGQDHGLGNVGQCFWEQG